MTRIQRLLALATLSLSLVACVPRIYSIEQFSPVSTESTLAMRPVHEHWGDRYPIGDMRGDPAIWLARTPSDDEGDGLRVSIVFRETGTCLGGFILPFVPLFGAYKDSEGFPIVVSIDDLSTEATIDIAEMRLFVNDSTVALRPKADLSPYWSHYVFDATYAEADTLRLEYSVQVPGGTSSPVAVTFAKGTGRVWDHGVLAARGPRSAPKTYLNAYDPEQYPLEPRRSARAIEVD